MALTSPNIDISGDPSEVLCTREEAISWFFSLKEEYEESHIPNSTLMDIKDPKSFIEEIENLDKDLNYYVYCHSGVRSVQACQIMKTFGINNVYNLLGGISEWDGELVKD